MRYAVIQTGGKQYRVSPGDVLEVDKLVAEPGSDVELSQVLLVADGDSLTVGKPLIEGAHVLARVLAQERARKIVVFKYKPKKRYRRKSGHRQDITRLSIKEISAV